MKSPLVLLLAALALVAAIRFVATRPAGHAALQPEVAGETPAAGQPRPAELAVSEPRPVESAPTQETERSEVIAAPETSRDGTLHVRVLRENDDSPVPGARVVLRQGRGGRAVYLEGSTGSLGGAPLTDAHGTATFAVPPRLELILQAYAFEQALETFSTEVSPFEPNEERELIVHLPVVTRATVTGFLRNEEGDAVVGQKIGFARNSRAKGAVFTNRTRFEQQTATDETGRFTLFDVKSGDWKIGPVPRPGIVPAARHLNIAPGTPEHHVDLTLVIGHFIEGVVVDAAGDPVAGARVSASLARTGDAFPGVDSAGNGQFKLEALLPGEYNVTASLREGLIAPSRPQRVMSDSRDVVLTLRAGGAIIGRLSGHDVDVRGALRLYHLYDSKFEREATSFGRSGFSFDSLEEGSYSLIASSGRLVAHSPNVRVRAGEETRVDLLLELGGRVEIVLPDHLESAMCIVEQGGARLQRIEIRSGDGISPLPARETTLSIYSHVPVTSSYAFDKAEGSLEVRVVAEETVIADFSR